MREVSAKVEMDLGVLNPSDKSPLPLFFLKDHLFSEAFLGAHYFKFSPTSLPFLFSSLVLIFSLLLCLSPSLHVNIDKDCFVHCYITTPITVMVHGKHQ